jgi:ribosomal protein L11 methyltransferase
MSEEPTPPTWWEVSLRVKEELAESVADVLARFAPGGVALGYDAIKPDPDGEGWPAGPLTVRAYLPADAEMESRRSRLEKALWHLGQISPLPDPEWRAVIEKDWSLEWKKHYRPIRIGRRLRIVPSWMDPAPFARDLVLRLDPGMAFGTGMHPTTQLCLETLEDIIRPGMDIIDLGCGSGILAIAAVKLGAAQALGVDIDPAAVRVARENALLNGVESSVEIRPGSLPELLKEERSASLVVANILALVVREMLAAGLARTVQPHGRLVLSGILEEQSVAVEAAIRDAGLRVDQKRIRQDWVALVAEKLAVE